MQWSAVSKAVPLSPLIPSDFVLMRGLSEDCLIGYGRVRLTLAVFLLEAEWLRPRLSTRSSPSNRGVLPASAMTRKPAMCALFQQRAAAPVAGNSV
jgi:hypothetical protein